MSEKIKRDSKRAIRDLDASEERSEVKSEEDSDDDDDDDDESDTETSEGETTTTGSDEEDSDDSTDTESEAVSSNNPPPSTIKSNPPESHNTSVNESEKGNNTSSPTIQIDKPDPSDTTTRPSTSDNESDVDDEVEQSSPTGRKIAAAFDLIDRKLVGVETKVDQYAKWKEDILGEHWQLVSQMKILTNQLNSLSTKMTNTKGGIDNRSKRGTRLSTTNKRPSVVKSSSDASIENLDPDNQQLIRDTVEGTNELPLADILAKIME